jgi:hypothetical protein
MTMDIASLLTGAAPQLSATQKAGRGLSAISAGLMGQGPQFMQQIQQQDQQSTQQAQQLSAQRLKAMALDAQRVDQLLQAGDTQGALRVVDNRTAAIKKLGGDPSDTVRIRGQIMMGNIPAARAEIGEFLTAAQSFGLIDKPQQPEIIPQSAISPTGQVAMRGADGDISAQSIPDFQAAPAEPAGTKVVGDYLVDAATGDILFDASASGGGSAEHGLNPLIFRNPETGAYSPYLPTKAGTMTQLETPQGLEFVPDAARLAYNPNNIQERSAAETEAERIKNLPTAERAALRRQEQATVVDNTIDEAISKASGWTTGMGSVLSRIPGTDARDLAGLVTTLEGNLAIDKLQEMRANSPTGGALGSVTERELELLSSTFGSLKQNQSKEQFLRNLEKVREQVRNIVHGGEQQFVDTYGRNPGAGAPVVPMPIGNAPAAAGGSVLRFDAQGNLIQ